MYYNMLFRFMLIVVVIVGMSISPGCSNDNERKKKMEAERVLQEEKREEIRARLREQVRKEQEKRNPKGISGDEQIAKKHRAEAEYCMKEFQKCTETCSDSRCENICLKVLSECEKNLPTEFQTLKKE